MSMRRSPEKNVYDHGASAGNCWEMRHGAGEGTRKRGDCVSHLANADAAALAPLATAAVEVEERQTMAAAAALVSSWLAYRQ